MKAFIITISVLLGIVIAIVGPIVLIISGFTWSTAQGEHTGYVTATQTAGIFWKTNSVFFKTNTTSTQEDQYCVTDPTIFQELQADQQSSKQITMDFSNGHFMPVWDCGNGDESIIISIK